MSDQVWLIAICLVPLVLLSWWGAARGVRRGLLRNSLGLYLIVGYMYYCLPLSKFIFAPVDLDLAIKEYALALGCATVAIVGGYMIGFREPARAVHNGQWSQGRQVAVFAIVAVGVALFVYYQIWRIENGFFFTHARYHEQELDIASGLRDVVVGSIHSPLLLLACRAEQMSGPAQDRWRQRWDLCIKTLMFLFVVVFVLSSQTRPAVTTLVMFAAFYPKDIGRRTVVALFLIGMGVPFVIMTVRSTATATIADSDNQFTAALDAIPTAARDLLLGESDAVLDRVQGRSLGGVTFFTGLSRQLQDGGYLGGATVWRAVTIAVPRLVWPEKPAFSSPQWFIQGELGLLRDDAPCSPVNQFFAEGGIAGVCVGHFLLGLLLRWMNRFWWSGLSALLVIVCLWSSLVNVENEVITGVLNALRLGIALVVFVKVFEFGIAAFGIAKGGVGQRVLGLGKADIP